MKRNYHLTPDFCRKYKDDHASDWISKDIKLWHILWHADNAIESGSDWWEEYSAKFKHESRRKSFDHAVRSGIVFG